MTRQVHEEYLEKLIPQHDSRLSRTKGALADTGVDMNIVRYDAYKNSGVDEEY